MSNCACFISGTVTFERMTDKQAKQDRVVHHAGFVRRGAFARVFLRVFCATTEPVFATGSVQSATYLSSFTGALERDMAQIVAPSKATAIRTTTKLSEPSA